MRFVVVKKKDSNTTDVVVTVTAATNGSGSIFKPCLRKLCEIADINAAASGKAVSNKRHRVSPECLPEMTQMPATIKMVPE